MTDVIDQPQAGSTLAPTDSGAPTGATPAAPPAAAPQIQPPAPVDAAALQRWNTQLSQENARLRQALGIGKDASDADIATAVARLKGREDSKLPPELLAERAALREERWEVEAMRYGDIAVAARDFETLAQHGGDPKQLAATFYQAVRAAAQGLNAPGTTPVEASQPTGDTPAQATPSRPSSVTSGSEPPLTPPPPDVVGDLRDSGDAIGWSARLRQQFGR